MEKQKELISFNNKWTYFEYREMQIFIVYIKLEGKKKQYHTIHRIQVH